MKIDRNKVLTDSEISNLKSKSLYWKEVREREDATPLISEALGLYRVLGETKLLRVIEHYIELLEEERTQLIVTIEGNPDYFDDVKERIKSYELSATGGGVKVVGVRRSKGEQK